jgi:hypothetical protein
MVRDDSYEDDPAGTIVVEDEALRSGFTQIPNAILRRPDVTPGAKLTYMALLSYAWQKGSCFPGQDTLADDLGVSKRSVVTYLQQLQDAGLLHVKRRGLGQTNIYTLPRFSSTPASGFIPRSAKSALQQVQKISPPEVQNLHRKKTQREEDPDQEDEEISNYRNRDYLHKATDRAQRNAKLRSRSIVDNSPSRGAAGHDPAAAAAPTGMASVGELLARRLPLTPAPAGRNTSRRGRLPKADYIATVVQELSARLHDDPKNTRANVTRAVRLWQASGLDERAFVEQVLYQARSLAQAQGNVTKRAGDGTGLRNKVPYFFAVVEDLLGLRGEARA